METSALDIRNLKAFIKYGIDEAKKPRKFLYESIGMSIFGMLAGVFGFFHNTATFVYASIAYICAFALIICSIVMTKKINLKKRVRYTAADSTGLTVMFAFDSAIFFETLGVPCSFLIPLIPLLTAGIALLIAQSNIKQKRYLKANKNFPGVFAASVAIGTSIGFVLSKFIRIEMTETQGTLFVSIVLLVLACVFSLGALNFLKLHCIKLVEAAGFDIER